MPWEDCFRALNAIGYDGPISIEWEDAGMDRLTGAPDALAYVRKLTAIDPAGHLLRRRLRLGRLTVTRTSAVLAEEGCDLLLAARGKEALEDLAGRLAADHGVDVAVHPVDLRQPEGVARLAAAVPDVDILVNGPRAALTAVADGQVGIRYLQVNVVCPFPTRSPDDRCHRRRCGPPPGLGEGLRAVIDLATAEDLAAQLRIDSIRSSTSAGSGHPTSSMSAADLIAVLVGRHLRYDWDNPGDDRNDHLIFSKGHASPLLYSVYKAVGVVSDEELMTGYRRFGSRLEGHPTPALPWVDVATGSLGQGLPDGVGIALAGKYLDRLDYRVWVLCGDSEMAEGSIWEALDKASYYRLANLIAIVDVNRLGQRGPTELQWNLDAYARRAEAFGARVLRSTGTTSSRSTTP